MAGRKKGRRNIPALAAMAGVLMIVYGVLWFYYHAEGSKPMLMPLGILLVAGAALAISGSSRRVTRNRDTTPARAYNYYAEQRAASNAASAAQRETWPGDGSYCSHCGLPTRQEDKLCRRCGEKLEFRD